MSLLIRVLVDNTEYDAVESSIIKGSDILELKSSHPKNEIDSNNESFSTIDFLFVNAEAKQVRCDLPTVFMIYLDGKLIFEGSDPRKFEEAYLKAAA